MKQLVTILGKGEIKKGIFCLEESFTSHSYHRDCWKLQLALTALVGSLVYA